MLVKLQLWGERVLILTTNVGGGAKAGFITNI